ncbi:pyridoxamine 5'-phosphate oxidase family protein [Curtobacterium flaccumfaciens]|uniref:pyridoxamine 5'-phosphate oxidase family protein n=1 Tax=Curtobacterium flaccumfaciens TaxID=2035 RepID=UPI001BDE514C|nr:pyridoxamine 5'-phosphate oxidase family protein [Curtobacterium flaccumfaciens]MCS5524720.1 pyridoxamine 5'-phosphate oxidase family protein [Curtobacterium flaccumfaciens pv. oortii]MCX2846842.1 pyridoxamine 5'-phosphate oxidase family protein [Curtobacterium flaccumfaciens pv. oortii]
MNAPDAAEAADRVPTRNEVPPPTMATPDVPLVDELVVILEPDQCWERLHRSRTARVAFRTEESLEIIPVNYVAQERKMVFATSSAGILAAVHDGRELVLEVDEHDGWTAWSVVAKGAGHLPDTHHVTAQHLRSMLPTPKRATVVLEPTSITGRLFDQAAP